MRVDNDSLGAVSIPDDVLYSSNTVRGAENFRLIGRPINACPNFVTTMAKVKKAAAHTLPDDYFDDASRRRVSTVFRRAENTVRNNR